MIFTGGFRKEKAVNEKVKNVLTALQHIVSGLFVIVRFVLGVAVIVYILGFCIHYWLFPISRQDSWKIILAEVMGRGVMALIAIAVFAIVIDLAHDLGEEYLRKRRQY